MADQWTVKQLTEALKSFPADAKVYYEMGPNGPGAIGKALRSALGRGRRTGSAAGPLGSASSRPEYSVASGTVASSTLGQAALSPLRRYFFAARSILLTYCTVSGHGPWSH